MGYEVTINDGGSQLVLGADTYQLEGPLTTFFSTDAGRRVVDSWSVRLASFRTADVVSIRRLADRPSRGASLAGRNGDLTPKASMPFGERKLACWR